MKARTLVRWLGGYLGLLALLGIVTDRWFSLGALATPVIVETHWRGGVRIARQIAAAAPPELSPLPDAFRITETVVGEAPLYAHPLFFTIGLVPGRDGVRAELDGKVAYATVDDLLAQGAYDRGHLWTEQSFGWGTYQPIVFSILAEQLGASPSAIASRARLRRVRFERRQVVPPRVVSPRPSTSPIPAPAPAPLFPRPERITAESLTPDLARDFVAEASTHLARSVGPDGLFRYMIDAAPNRTLPGYNWPRHAGATFFLAQAAGLLDDPFVRFAALRAADRLRDPMLRRCGANRCVGPEDGLVEIGSSALALIAFTEIVRTGADGSYRPAIVDLAEFLRSQQRPDGELMHFYDRAQKKAVDRQVLYFTGEAALALARAHAITGDPRDLAAARNALSRLAGGGWSFFGSRYYYSEEHWTCQAVAELWERAPDPEALAFCARWHEYQRRLQQDAADSPFDGEGAFNFGPLASPRLTPASSRGEAAGALLDVLEREHAKGHPSADLPPVDRELRRAVAFVQRMQFHPGPEHLFADPVAVRGAVPGSPVDWQLRIDYAQHAGSMMIRWLEVTARTTSR